MAKAIFDFLSAAVGLVLLSPVFLLVAVAIMLEDGLPIFFRQTRVGRYGKPFRLIKFRSMRTEQHPGSLLTAKDDSRVTRVGGMIRKFKLDELPQLWNVLRGDMSLVGPRPDVSLFVDLENETWQAVLRANPGITDLATLVYRNEEAILAGALDRERFYREVVLPDKLALNLEYLKRRSFWSDLRLIMLTLRYSLVPSGFDPDRIKQIFSEK